jgi:hypothetical protein
MCVPVCRHLPQTKTHPVEGARRYHWLPVPGAGDLVGVALICQGNRDTERYEVQEDTTADFPLRRWFFHRTSGDITEKRLGTYHVTLTPDGWTCDCTGYATLIAGERKAAALERRPMKAVACKHASVAKSLKFWGDLDAVTSEEAAA